jgi:hypothetical protein
MPNYIFSGKIYKPSQSEFFVTIISFAKGFVAIAKSYFEYHVTGFSDYKGIFKFPDVGQLELVETLTNAIDDESIRKNFILLRTKVAEMVEFDSEITTWLAKYVGLDSIDTRGEMMKLDRRLQKIISNKRSGTRGPVWIKEKGYQEMVRKSAKILNLITNIAGDLEIKVDKILARNN